MKGGVGRREEKGERELSGKDGGKGLELKGVCLIALPRERDGTAYRFSPIQLSIFLSIF